MGKRNSKQSSSSAAISIMKRDRDIFEFIGQHETVTFDQLRRKFWPNSVTNQTARDRLNLLRKAGYLAVHQDYWLNPEQSSKPIARYQLHRAALAELDPERASACYTGSLTDEEVKQAVAGAEARLAIEAQGYNVAEWVSERELKSEQRQGIAVGEIATGISEIADGQAVIVDPDTGEMERVEVEIDGDYWGKMLRSKLERFAGRQVVWACPKPSRVATIQNAVNEGGYKNIQVIAI